MNEWLLRVTADYTSHQVSRLGRFMAWPENHKNMGPSSPV